jgi:hypothetical protein
MSITPRSRRVARYGAAVAAVAGSLALAPTAMASASVAPPAPDTCPATVVRSAELVRTVNGPAIQVKGVAAGPNVDLHLVAEDVVFIQQPAYWNYFVVDCAPDRVVVKTPYTKLFRVPTAPVGRYGIQIGPSQINLPDATAVS